MTIEDELLVGAFDSHAHGHPEFTTARRGRTSMIEWAQRAADAGMRGFVIKSHVWPTTIVAATLSELYPDLDVVGSISLNPPVGGLSPVAVEMAAQTGGRVVWFPTWAAHHDPVRHSITATRLSEHLTTFDKEHALAEGAIRVVDGGRLSASALAVLDVCRDYSLTVASGHLPPEHSLLLAEAAAERGVRFILTHPCSASVAASLDQQRLIADLGGWIEHVFVSCMPMHQRQDPRDIAQAIRSVGAERCIMASDAGEAWNPPAPEVLRMFIATMLALGIPEADVHLMTHRNPLLALGLGTGPEAPQS